MSSLTDTFSGSSVDTAKWASSGAGAQTTISESGGTLNFTYTGGTANDVNLHSASAYSLVGSYFYAQIAAAGATATAGSGDSLVVECHDGANNYYLQWWLNAGTLQAGAFGASINNSSLYSAAFDAVNHKWLRIREASGTVYWDTSADGTTWTNRASVAYTDSWLSSAIGQLRFGQFGGGSLTATTVSFDNVNTTPSSGATTITGSAAAVTAAAPAGSLQADCSLAGTTASVSVSAPAGSLLEGQGSTITGTTAQVTAAAPAGTLTLVTVITGATAQVTAAAPAGTLQYDALISGVTAQVVAEAPAGSLFGAGARFPGPGAYVITASRTVNKVTATAAAVSSVYSGGGVSETGSSLSQVNAGGSVSGTAVTSLSESVSVSGTASGAGVTERSSSVSVTSGKSTTVVRDTVSFTLDVELG